MAVKRDPNFPMQGKLGHMGGTYGRKAENLTKRELKAAGASKAAAGPKVSISQTRRDTTRGLTLGPKGKPLTGRVTLSNGNTAVYKAGKRVMKAAASRPATGGSGGSGNGSSGAGAKKVSSYTPGKKQGAGTEYARLRNEAKAARGSNTRYSPSAGGSLSKASAAKAQKSAVSQAAKKNPYLGGRAQGVYKKKDGTYSTNSGVTGKTATEVLRKKKQIDKNNQVRDSIAIASIPLAMAGAAFAPEIAAGTAAARGVAGAAAARGASRLGSTRVGGEIVKDAKALSNKVGVQTFKAGKAASKAKSAVKSGASKAKSKVDMKVKGQTKVDIKPKTGSVRKPGDMRPMDPAKPTRAQKTQATKANNKLKAGKK